MGGKLI